MCRIEIFTDLLEEYKTGLRITETHRATPGKNTEERAELRGRENTYRTCVDQLRRAICQHDRMGEPSLPEAALAHIEAVERLLDAVNVSGYKSEYSKGVACDQAIKAKRCIIALWNVTSE